MEKEKRRKYYGMNKTTTKKKSEERINDKRFTRIEEDSIQVEVFYYHLYYNDIGEHAAKTKGVLQYNLTFTITVTFAVMYKLLSGNMNQRE